MWVEIQRLSDHALLSKSGAMDENCDLKLSFRENWQLYRDSVLQNPADTVPTGLEHLSIRFANYSINEGLAGMLVTGIAQDSFGFVWIATRGGVSRFDGHQFKNYYLEAKDYVRCRANAIVVDKANNVWICNDQLLFRLNRKTERFEPFKTESCPEENCIPWLIHTSDGLIWFRNYKTQQLYSIDPFNLRVKLVRSGLINTDRSYRFFDNKGRFWFGGCTIGLIEVYDPKADTSHVYQYPFHCAHRFMDVEEGAMWMSSWSHGLVRMDLNTGKFSNYTFGNDKSPDKNAYFDCTTFPEMTGDSILWCGTGEQNEGIQLFNFRQKKFIGSIERGQDGAFALLGDRPEVLWRSPDTILWVGGKEGVSMLNSRKAGITRGSAIALNGIRQFECTESLPVRGRPGWYWQNLGWNGLIVHELSTGNTLRHYFKWDVQVLRIAYDRNGGFWVFTDSGIFCFDPNTDQFKNQSLFNPGIVVYDPERHEFLGLKEGQLQIFDPESSQIRAIPMNQPAKELLAGRVSGMVLDEGGILWFSTRSGLLRADTRNGKVERFAFHFEGRNDLFMNILQKVSIDKRNSGLWVLSDGGLIRFDRKTSQCELVLPLETIGLLEPRDMAVDSFGAVWIKNDLALMRYDPKTLRIKRYTVQEGLSRGYHGHLQIIGNHLFDYRDEANSHYTVVDCAWAARDMEPKPALLMHVTVKDLSEPIGLSGDAEKHFSVPFDQNVLEFHFTTVDFEASREFAFEVKLAGQENDWIYLSNKRSQIYTSLPPGKYTFQVRTVAPDGGRGPITSCDFKITPPWYATWWFHSLLTIAFVALVYLIFRYREIRRLEQEKLRLRIARDLHDEMGSTLSSISILSEAALLHLQTDIDRARFGVIGDRTRQVMDAMSDIVWSVNPRNDNMEKVLQRMKEFAVEILEAKAINLHFEADESAKSLNLSMEKRKDFYLLYKEAINNAAKYSDASHIWVTLRSDGNIQTLEVRDNGRGFDPATVKRGNGLWNMQRRAERMGGILRLESVVGEGTRV